MTRFSPRGRRATSRSSYARQFLGQMDKRMLTSSKACTRRLHRPESTSAPTRRLALITEIDYLRLLSTRVPASRTGGAHQAQTPQQIIDCVLTMVEGTLQVLSPVRAAAGRVPGSHRRTARGYTRAIIDSEAVRLELPPSWRSSNTIEVVIDRLVVRGHAPAFPHRFGQTALRLASSPSIASTWTKRRSAAAVSPRSAPARNDTRAGPRRSRASRTFSLQRPLRRVPGLRGTAPPGGGGPQLVVPMRNSRSPTVLSSPTGLSFKVQKLLESLVQGTRLRDGHALGLPKKVKNAVLYGKDYEVTVKFRNRWGRRALSATGFEGAVSQ